MKKNTPNKAERTFGGAVAAKITEFEKLKRMVSSCLLWEKSFYEDGEDVAKRIESLVAICNSNRVADLAVYAREKLKLRHVPLLLACELAKKPDFGVRNLLPEIIERADELTEFLAIYWRNGRKPLSAQIKKGLAIAFSKFNEYSLAKYNRDGAIKLRDVLFLCHAKPSNDEQSELWKRLINNELAPAGTWEERLSAGEDKKTVFEDLLKTRKLGYMALLRNLRNMEQSQVDIDLICTALIEGAATSKALPFRYIAANNVVCEKRISNALEKAMLSSLANTEKLTGKTLLLVDVSLSMVNELSKKSELTRIDAASALAMLLNGICKDLAIFSFSEETVRVAVGKGFAIQKNIWDSQDNEGTLLGKSLLFLSNNYPNFDRIIIITDEQSNDDIRGNLPWDKKYIINVANYQNGIDYKNFIHINGFSESVINYITEVEKG